MTGGGLILAVLVTMRFVLLAVIRRESSNSAIYFWIVLGVDRNGLAFSSAGVHDDRFGSHRELGSYFQQVCYRQ